MGNVRNGIQNFKIGQKNCLRAEPTKRLAPHRTVNALCSRQGKQALYFILFYVFI